MTANLASMNIGTKGNNSAIKANAQTVKNPNTDIEEISSKSQQTQVGQQNDILDNEEFLGELKDLGVPGDIISQGENAILDYFVGQGILNMSETAQYNNGVPLSAILCKVAV